ncbi:MAG TPA: apolipoprotein N-acyltransferase [Anaeromyxobacteraceae bacterium]|nr:apolipoprotein N-acyltransferase [Anaeromyxobacteraceae bacterium]
MKENRSLSPARREGQGEGAASRATHSAPIPALMKRSTPFLLAVASGLSMALALPLVIPWLSLRELDPHGRLEVVAWVALLPLLWALDGAPRARRAFSLGFLGGLAYFYVAIYWVSHAMTAFGGLPTWLAFVALSLLVGYMAVHWGGALAVAWWVRRRLGWPLWAQLPFVWAAFELLRNYSLSGFPWGNLGYTQARTLPVAQLAAVTGVYGIAALVVLVNALVHDGVRAVTEGRLPAIHRGTTRRHGLALLAVLGLAFGLGEARLSAVRREIAAAPALRVGIVQANVDQSVKNTARDHVEEILGRLVPRTVEADRAGAELVAWPEAAYPMYLPPGLRSLDVPGVGLPPLSRTHLLLGATTLERGAPDGEGQPTRRITNSVFLLTPGLDVVGRHAKEHLVPFGEYVPLARWLSFLHQVVPTFAPVSPGPEEGALVMARPAGAVRIAPLICYDAIFPEIARRFARTGADLLVNPTNDAWYGYSSGPYQFLAMVRLRAIETGRTVLRPAWAGVSALLLPTGEVAPGAIEIGPVDPDLAPAPEEPSRLLLADAPLLRGTTLYTRFGDLFGWGCSLFTVAALALAWRAARRPATQ